jgi:single stranded DNA-binding protein
VRQGYNKVIFAGRIESSPELRRTPRGVAIGAFSLCVPKSRAQEEDVLVDVVAFRRLAEEYCPLLTVGRTVLVEGVLAPYRWHKAEGARQRAYEVHATTIRILEE